MNIGCWNRMYYRRSGIIITEDYIAVSGQKYNLEELHNLSTMRGPYNPTAVSSSIGAVVLALGVLIGWPRHDQLSSWFAIIVLLATLLGLAALILRVKRRRYELWGEYRGLHVRILDMAEADAFGQVCRALIRARESHTTRTF